MTPANIAVDSAIYNNDSPLITAPTTEAPPNDPLTIDSDDFYSVASIYSYSNSVVSNEKASDSDDDDTPYFGNGVDTPSDISEGTGTHSLLDEEVTLLHRDLLLPAELWTNHHDDESAAESDGTVEDVWDGEIPHRDDEPAPPTPEARATKQMIDLFNLTPITTSLSDVFECRSIPGDGNCFLHCCKLSAFLDGFDDLYGTPTVYYETKNHSMTFYRHQIFRYLANVLLDNVRTRPFQDCIGNVLPDFQGSRRTVLRGAASKIWGRWINFDKGAKREYYCDIIVLFSIIAHMQRRDVTVYDVSNTVTYIFIYYNELHLVRKYEIKDRCVGVLKYHA